MTRRAALPGGILAVALLAGGLAVLVLDLGRPERLIVAILKHNFKSIFAWNIYLYTGFMAIVAAYLFAMMDRRASQNAALGRDLVLTDEAALLVRETYGPLFAIEREINCLG